MQVKRTLKLRKEFRKEFGFERDVIKNVKLPKLVITKFQGMCVDWMRFWNQFDSEIDKSPIDPVAKFSYLKELVHPKVRNLIDGLPFNGEGYERAKTILE